jgi:hypothetical protein
MDILAQLNSGALHAKARAARPDCVDSNGGIHRNPERAAYVTWRIAMTSEYGMEISEWPEFVKAELARRYVKRASA